MEEMLRRRLARLTDASSVEETATVPEAPPDSRRPTSGLSGAADNGDSADGAREAREASAGASPEAPRPRRRRFAYPPALIVVDGGRGQLGVAAKVLEEAGLDIPAIGLAKRLEEVYVPGRPEPLDIPRGSEALFVLQHLRDEAHRFAITYHRSKRTKRALRSPLDEIPGVGQTRRKALLRRFGSMARLRAAAREEIAATPGIGPALAATIHD